MKSFYTMLVAILVITSANSAHSSNADLDSINNSGVFEIYIAKDTITCDQLLIMVQLIWIPSN